MLESWTNTFGTSKSSQLLEQVKVCAEIGIDCMHDDPSRRPDIYRILFVGLMKHFSAGSISYTKCTCMLSHELPIIDIVSSFLVGR